MSGIDLCGSILGCIEMQCDLPVKLKYNANADRPTPQAAIPSIAP